MTRPVITGAAAITAALTLSLTGCGAISGGSTGEDSGGELREVQQITYVNPLPSYPDFNVAGECFKEQAEEYGWEATEVGITGTSVDNQGSINQISQAVVSGADALVVFPTVNELFTPVIKEARSEGVYVVALNAGDPSTGQQTQVGTDNYAMGQLMADGLGEKDPAAHVGFISLSASTQPHADMIQGFTDRAAEKYPDIVISASEFDGGDATKDVDIFNNMLTAHPDITALFPIEGAAIPAAVTSVRERGLTGTVNVIGLDLTPEHRQMLIDGELYGIGMQGWCEAGKLAVTAVHDLAEGKDVPEFIPTESTFVTAETLPDE